MPPRIWLHPTRRKAGTEDGIALVFSSIAEMRQLVNVLTGSLLAHDTRKT